jgi:hypothetical protein
MEKREWFIGLDPGVRIAVATNGRPIAGYVVRLELLINDAWVTVRLFDNVHGRHDEHAYVGQEKQGASDFFYGPTTQALPTAIGLLEERWAAIIEVWKGNQK